MTELKNHSPEFLEEETDIEDSTGIELEKEDIITEPFDPSKIRVDTRPMTIDLVLSRLEYNELDLAPEFQRQAGIWTDIAKSRLIESILIRIPLPAFYMDATNEDKWLVIDGLQRLTALKQFVIDKQLRLKGLDYLKEIEGKNYDEIPRNYQRRIKETVLTVYLIEKGTPPEVKFNIFSRINTGGLPLSPQELRHALNAGKATKLLAQLAGSQEFRKATGNFTKKRMEDSELVLRFLAFTITPYTDYDAKIIDIFFNEAMAKINKMSEPEIQSLSAQFFRSMSAAHKIFGASAFRKISKQNRRRKFPLNKALFEAFSVAFSKLTEPEIKLLEQQKQDLIESFINRLDADKEFNTSISESTSKVSNVKYRFSTIENLIKEVLS
ncbi:MAG: DUF262 domain-containing protein [Oscillatoria sp. Prado101]|nr:DUF262 domain-containing protein [Oscillatoria sp. Prado101]